jgi:hypothetical protein
MKTNIKALQLIEKGLSSNTVSKLNESQINVLHTKMFTEQATNPKVAQKMKDIGALNQQLTSVELKMKNLGLEEDDDFDLDADQAYTGQQGSHDEYQASDDGMDDDTSPENHDSKMIGMSEEKDGEPNPYSICHAQVGPKKSRKFERCVMSVKKQLKEGKNPVSLFLETQIEKIVERNMPPKITKGDLVRYISEQGTAPSPTTKPAPTKPGVSPGKKPRPAHPGKNPNPGENPAPKAKKVSPEDAKEKVIDVIMQILQK